MPRFSESLFKHANLTYDPTFWSVWWVHILPTGNYWIVTFKIQHTSHIFIFFMFLTLFSRFQLTYEILGLLYEYFLQYCKISYEHTSDQMKKMTFLNSAMVYISQTYSISIQNVDLIRGNIFNIASKCVLSLNKKPHIAQLEQNLGDFDKSAV